MELIKAKIYNKKLISIIMKKHFQFIFLFAGIIFFIGGNILNAQGITYYSAGNLPANLLSSWVMGENGSMKNPANFTSGDTFIIRSGHKMKTTGEWKISGNYSALCIEEDGVLEANNPISLSPGTIFFIDNGGKYLHNYSENNNNTPSIFKGTNKFRYNSTVEILKWNYSEATGEIADFPEGITWGNLTLKWHPEVNDWSLFTSSSVVEGNFTIDVNNDEHFISMDKEGTGLVFRVGGDFIIKSGTLYYSTGILPGKNLFILDIAGNYKQTGGKFAHIQNSSPLTINLKGFEKSFAYTNGILDVSNINWVIDVLACYSLESNISVDKNGSMTVGVLGTLDCSSYSVTGEGDFTLSKGATLKTSHISGVNGSISVAGIKTLTPATTNYVFYGDYPQITGSLIPSAINDLTINNKSGEGVTLSKSITIGNTLYMSQGKIRTLNNVDKLILGRSY